MRQAAAVWIFDGEFSRNGCDVSGSRSRHPSAQPRGPRRRLDRADPGQDSARADGRRRARSGGTESRRHRALARTHRRFSRGRAEHVGGARRAEPGVRLPAGMSWLLWPAALVFEVVVRPRRGCYRRGGVKQRRPRGGGISVGNLTVGGTRKPPMALGSKSRRCRARPWSLSRAASMRRPWRRLYGVTPQPLFFMLKRNWIASAQTSRVFPAGRLSPGGPRNFSPFAGLGIPPRFMMTCSDGGCRSWAQRTTATTTTIRRAMRMTWKGERRPLGPQLSCVPRRTFGISTAFNSGAFPFSSAVLICALRRASSFAKP